MTRLFLSFAFVLVVVACNPNEEPRPVITSLSISLASVGKQVTINGRLFSSSAAENLVAFNGTQAQVTSAKPGQLDVIVPAGATSGKVTVTVNGHTAVGPNFTVYTPGSLISFSPVCGPENTEITIEGTGFETNMADMQVIFDYFYIVETSPNGYSSYKDKIGLTIEYLSDTQIKVSAPSGIPAEANGDLQVKAFGTEQLYVQGTTNGTFHYAMMPFAINDFFPKVGKAGTLVTFTGTGFENDFDRYRAFFHDGPSHIVQATVTNITSTELTVEVPVGVITGEIAVFYNWNDGKSHAGAAEPGMFTVQP